ncbi:hypothetical protein EVAR_28311_1 [Eumeta japonica]|uniref:Pupal cuticle protein G1A n=1 Tax=Eumeta variegata TaxID=151549 RepID=A0A4C1V9M3_EUMVA|nr:hypothetical protein EVAR_28311_1 [Eumeta japonica]
MYTLVVLLSALAAAAAKPGAVIAPLAYSHSVIAPVSTTITRQASSIVHPSPVVYSTPLAYAHLIKKRSAILAPVSTYIAPTAYAASLVTPTYTTSLVHGAPIVHTAPVAYTAAHLIKKRSAPLTTLSTYIAPTAYAAYPTTIATAPVVHSAPIVATAPVAYASHFIKKRSADVAVLAPTSVSHQSRVDLHSTPAVVTTFASPLTYSAPIAYSHVF